MRLQRNAVGIKSTRAFLYTPRAAGGVGLVSIGVAVKTQQMKHGLLWLTQRVDRYVAAWKF